MEASHGGAVNHLLPCTASDKETCQIVAELVTWNKLLLGSRFEIREDPETCNQLCITNSTTAPRIVDIFDEEHWPQCQELLVWLLTTHRCIGSVSVKLSAIGDTSPSLLRAVCQNRWIKTMSIDDINASAATTVFDILPYLTSVKKLHLTDTELPPDLFVAPLSALLEASRYLHSLHIRGKFAEDGTIGTLFTALLEKDNLEELRFQDLSVHGDACPQSVREYIGSTNSLKVLSVTMRTPSMQTTLLEGVLENRSIERLSLDLFMGREEITPLVSRIIKTNRAIRTLHISRSVPDPPGLFSVYNCWVLPLVENNTLEEVRVPINVLRSETWSAFFRALPGKENLKMVHIVSPYYDPCLHWLCAELKRSGSDGKVSLEPYTLTDDIEVLHCKAFSGADLSMRERERTLDALARLPNCQHLKTVCMYIKNNDMTLSLAIAEFLRSTTTLQRLELRADNAVLVNPDGQNPCWNVILESLSQNRSLRRLGAALCDMGTRDAGDLADSVKRNTCIRRLYLDDMLKANATAFFRRLSMDIEENYRLTAVDYNGHIDEDAVSDWLTVRATTWRNCGLVARAARIKQASHFDRYVTRAVDRVSRYPALLDEVARSAKLDQAELAVLVRDRLRQIRSLDGFMRVAGVVKERVICHPTADGRTQLDDLNEDCWSHVRRYLATDDVKHGAVQVNNG